MGDESRCRPAVCSAGIPIRWTTATDSVTMTGCHGCDTDSELKDYRFALMILVVVGDVLGSWSRYDEGRDR